MRIIKMKGGLGNQMFQYVFAKLIEDITGDETKLDFSVFNQENSRVHKPRIQRFQLSLDSASEDDCHSILKVGNWGKFGSKQYKIGLMVERVINPRFYFELGMDFVNPDRLKKYSYFDGYWQSWKYYDMVANTANKDFSPVCLSEEAKRTISTVESENSVFVGIRHGDYGNLKKIYGSFEIDYYLQAMEQIEKRVKNPHYYIFSDDIDWVIQNYDFKGRDVSYRTHDVELDDFEEFMIMSYCKHSVIINSTYHWWAAKLRDNDDKVIIAPKKWFNNNMRIDIVPPHWITV